MTITDSPVDSGVNVHDLADGEITWPCILCPGGGPDVHPEGTPS